MTAPCPSPRMITWDQHSVHNLLDLVCALGYAETLVSLVQRRQSSRPMSGAVTTGQRVRHGGGVGLLAQQRVQQWRLCGCERRALEGRQKYRNRCLLRPLASPRLGAAQAGGGNRSWAGRDQQGNAHAAHDTDGGAACVGASLILASTVEQYAHVASGGFGRHSR
jgi:hypothetical protein